MPGSFSNQIVKQNADSSLLSVPRAWMQSCYLLPGRLRCCQRVKPIFSQEMMVIHHCRQPTNVQCFHCISDQTVTGMDRETSAASRHVTWDFRSAKIPLRSYHGRNSAAVETDCTDWFISRCCQHDRIQLPFKFDMPKTRQGHCIVIPSHFHECNVWIHGLLSPLLVS